VKRQAVPQNVTVTRAAASAYDVNGRVSLGSASSFSIQAAVQPATGRDLMRLPEAFRVSDVQAVWSPVPLRTFDQPSATPADVLTLANGAIYQVEHVEDWSGNGTYFKVLARRIGT
jgi:hypothetical protein